MLTEFRTFPTLCSTPVATSALPACRVISSSCLCRISFSFSCFFRSEMSLISAVNVGDPSCSNTEIIISTGSDFLSVISLPCLKFLP